MINRRSIKKVCDWSLQFLCRCVIQSEAIVIDRNFCYEKMWSITKPVEKCWPMSLSKGHLQVLTPKVIDHESINKIFDRSLQPLSRCVIHSKAKVIDHTFSNEKMWSIAIPSGKMWTHSHNEGYLQVLTPKVIDRTFAYEKKAIDHRFFVDGYFIFFLEVVLYFYFMNKGNVKLWTN